MDTATERSDGKTAASQLLLFSIKHSVCGLAWPQEQGVYVYVCVRPQERGPVESS